MELVLISAAAASFGGTSLLAWYPSIYARRPTVDAPAVAVGIPRARGWLVAGAVTFALFVGVLGRGITF